MSIRLILKREMGGNIFEERALALTDDVKITSGFRSGGVMKDLMFYVTGYMQVKADERTVLEVACDMNFDSDITTISCPNDVNLADLGVSPTETRASVYNRDYFHVALSVKEIFQRVAEAQKKGALSVDLTNDSGVLVVKEILKKKHPILG